MALIVPSSIGSSYVLPVRLSVIVRVSLVTAASGLLDGAAAVSFVGVLMRDLRLVIRGSRRLASVPRHFNEADRMTSAP